MDSGNGAPAPSTSGYLPKRRNPCWITSYVKLTEHLDSPAIFRKWAALTAISAAIERKVYITVQNRQLFGNLFVLLVGPPGVGKTTAIQPVRQMLLEMKDFRIAPQATSKEKFLDHLAKSIKTDMDLASMNHSSFSVFLDEFSTFLRPMDFEFMTQLTDLYDCPNHWEYSIISRQPTIIEHVYLTLIGGITPATVAKNLTHHAFGMGFTARIFFIYSEEFQRKKLFTLGPAPDYSSLIADLSLIHNLRGEFFLEPEAIQNAEEWVASGMSPLPRDSRFAEYIPRRSRHWLKLSMLLSAGRRQDRIITAKDLADAKALLLEAEEVMPLAIEAVGTNPLADAIRNAHKWCLIEYRTRGNVPIVEMKLRYHLMQNVPPQYMDVAINSMTQSGLLSPAGDAPNRTFTPILRD